MTLREWLEKLEEIDPDDWGEIDTLRTTFSEEQLGTDLEAEITFVTTAGAVDHVTIQIFDNQDQIVVDFEYSIFQLDLLPLLDFIQAPLFPPLPDTKDEAQTTKEPERQ